MAASSALSPEDRAALDALAADLHRVFGTRLQSVVAYGLDDRAAEGPLHTLALVERLTFEDLAACASLTRGWRRRGLDAPLLLERDEFTRTLDVFPLEYGAIIAQHVRIHGGDPFDGLAVSDSDTRRAIEQHAKSLLIHLREGYLEAAADPRAIKQLIAASTPALRTLLANIARLEDDPTVDPALIVERRLGVPAGTVQEVFASPATGAIEDPSPLFARYLDAAERIWEYADGWRR